MLACGRRVCGESWNLQTAGQVTTRPRQPGGRVQNSRPARPASTRRPSTAARGGLGRGTASRIHLRAAHAPGNMRKFARRRRRLDAHDDANRARRPRRRRRLRRRTPGGPSNASGSPGTNQLKLQPPPGVAEPRERRAGLEARTSGLNEVTCRRTRRAARSPAARAACLRQQRRATGFRHRGQSNISPAFRPPISRTPPAAPTAGVVFPRPRLAGCKACGRAH